MRTFVAAFAILAAAAGAARAGDLIPTEPRFGPLRIASHRIDVVVDNQIAMTKVEQVFANDHPAVLEAHYVFPVPKGASIVDFSMTVNGKLVRGELLEKDKARSIYEGIVRQSKDPGLLEHVGANLFRVRVFPIQPASQQKIELTYVERINYDAGACRYVYPLLVPGGAKTTRADEFDFRWRLASAVPIQDVTCTTHAANVARQGESSAEVKFSGRQIDLSKDLEVGYRIERPTSGMDLVAHRPKDEDGTFMLLLTPQSNPRPLPKDMTFVFDTSGSMEGPRIRQARAALKFCLAKVRDGDRFNILTFSSDVTAWKPAHVEAGEATRADAGRFVDQIDATGGTNINAALLRALEHRAADGRPHLIVFLTDGDPTVGETTPARIVQNVSAANRAGVRIFAFGVGDELHRGLLEDLAETTRGVAEFVSDQENIEEKVSRLQKKIGTPVLSDLSIDWGKAEVSAVYPKSPGDLFAGTQLMVTGRYRKAGAFEVVLKGRQGKETVELRQTLVFPEKIDVAPAVPYLWAMRKIAGQLDELRRNGNNPEVVAEVIALSKQYRIATPYTSFLVLESEAAYDQQGIDRRGNSYKPPTPTVQAPPPAPATPNRGTGKVYVPPADRSETTDHEAYEFLKGDAGGFRGRAAGAPSTDPAPDSGARYGSRQMRVSGGAAIQAAEDAVSAALKWLAHHQNPDGSWSAADFDDRCTGKKCSGKGERDSDVAATSLTLLAFLGAGYSQLSKDEFADPADPGKVLKVGEVIKKGLQWLLSQQDAEGGVGPRRDLRNQALAALALSEAYGMTAAQPLQEPAQKAIDFLAAQPTPADPLIAGWVGMALKSAALSDLTVPPVAVAGVLDAFSKATGADHRVATPPGTTERHPTRTAAGIAVRILLQRDRKGAATGGIPLLMSDPPEWSRDKTDPLHWYLATVACMQYDGPDGSEWKKWGEPMKNVLVPNQKTASDGCLKGSWEPMGFDGRVATTALNCLTLELYYRYANVFGRPSTVSGGTPPK